jgi:predicted HicB family RNase H-like nuclease
MTPLRSVRIATDLWESAKAKAQEQGTTVSHIIIKALQEFIK